MDFTLKMNLLFFDEILASAPALLRNHILCYMSQSNDPNVFESLKKIYGEGFIRPVLIEGNQNIISVGKKVISDNKIVQEIK